EDKCSLVERRDAAGHHITYARDRSGLLLRMESEGQSIAFDYDDRERVIRAYDSLQREVTYAYDEAGRLIRAAGSDGVVRMYEYDSESQLVAVHEPGRIVQNWFDAEGRWTRQVVRWSEGDDDPYVATGRYRGEDGAIVEASLDEGDGMRVTRYNRHHYIVTETVDAEGPRPIVFTMERDPTTNVLHGVTMSCAGPSGPVTRPV